MHQIAYHSPKHVDRLAKFTASTGGDPELKPGGKKVELSSLGHAFFVGPWGIEAEQSCAASPEMISKTLRQSARAHEGAN